MRASPEIKGVIFDIGNVVVRWDPRTLYAKIFPDPAECDWFLTQVCTMAWHTAHDAGASVALFEKHTQVGGTTGLSGGVMWIPLNPFAAANYMRTRRGYD